MLDSIIATLALGVTSSKVAGFDDETARGWHRGGLEMVPHRASDIQLRETLTTDTGALAFWIFPETPGKDPHDSYTILSARWGDAASGYFAVSQGWWEPLGTNRFHAVISNRDAAFCIADRPLALRRWTHVVVSWRGTHDGYCRIYFDGEIAVNRAITVTHPVTVRARFAIGSDREATDRRQREARGTFDELEYFPQGITDAQVRKLYQRDVPDSRVRQRRAFDWAEPFQTAAARAPARETRALFDESWQWARTPADVENLVDLARRAGFNVIVPCVWHGRGAAWPARLAHRQSELTEALESFDPLTLLVERAHRAGIEVHPWFTVVRREDDRHPEWFDPGTPSTAYDIHKAGFRLFAASLIEEVVSRYAVDGVHLDYIRAMGICTSESCARSYAQATGRNLSEDLPASTVVGPARASIERWQDETMRALVTDIGRRVRARRSNVHISVSGHPVPANILRPLEGRAEVDWRRRGLIDSVFAMEYGAVPRHERIAAVAAELGDPAGLVWVFANFDRLDGVAVARPPEYLAEYIRFARARVPASGIAVYLRAMLNSAQIDALARGPFRDRVPSHWPGRPPS